MQNKLTNTLLSIIAACLAIQTGLRLSGTAEPVTVRNDSEPISVVITNGPVMVDFVDSFQLSFGHPAMPVSIEGFNGRPFYNAQPETSGTRMPRKDVLPVEIEPR